MQEINQTMSRMLDFLKSEDFRQADAAADYLLHIAPGFGSAYVGKLLAEFRLKELSDLLYTEAPYTVSENYKHALYYSDPKIQQFLKTAPYENFYIRSKNRMEDSENEDDLKVAAGMFRQIAGYRDSDDLYQQCVEKINTIQREDLYQKAVSLMDSASDEDSWKAAADAFACVNGHGDAGEKRDYCLQKVNEFKKDKIYLSAKDPTECKDLKELQDSLQKYDSIRDWKDAAEKADLCRNRITDHKKKASVKLRKRVLLIVGTILAIVIVCALVFWIIPLSRYNRANELVKNGSYTEAAAAFRELNGFMDSDVKAREAESIALEDKYQKALSLMAAENYQDASAAFTALEDYKDSRAKVSECESLRLEQQYNNAVLMVREKNFSAGIEALLALNGYKDSAEVIESSLAEKADALSQMEISEAAAELEKMDSEITTAVLERLDGDTSYKLQLYAAVVGDVLTFGHYEQDDDLSNGSEPIEWVVLDHQKGMLTMISRYALEVRPYHDEAAPVSWSECSLRTWLNEDFYESAFSEAEQALIVLTQNENKAYAEGMRDEPLTEDKVYLPDIDEAERYFSSDGDRRAQAAEHTVRAGAEIEDGFATWWLRSAGYDNRNAAYVYSDGTIHRNGIYITSAQDSVRPMIQITL